MRGLDPEPPRCCWRDRRFPNNAAVMEHEAEHRRADIAMREAGVAMKDSRAMAERLAEAAEQGLNAETDR